MKATQQGRNALHFGKKYFWHSTRYKFGAWILQFQFKIPCTYFKFNVVILLKH